MNYKYNLQFEKLCTALELGELTKSPVAIQGGLLHKMVALETTKGKYAVKALNPTIMARPTALNNYTKSEKIVGILAEYVPVLPAQIYQGAFLQNIENQFYLIFDWIEGLSLKSENLENSHCNKIGNILGQIHKIDFSQDFENVVNSNSKKQIDWNFYLSKGQEMNAEWVNFLTNNMDHLNLWNNKALKSSMVLAMESVISHRDLEPKNVMWIKANPIIIDWESAGFINPKHDLIETAVYWSIKESGEIDKDKFHSFLYGYQEVNGFEDTDWRSVLELGYLSKLEWLEYSLKRSLKIECTDESEQEMGTRHVTETIEALKSYEESVSELENWLNNLKKV